MVSQPVFLVGAERSGTTLMRLMLDHHPDIAFLFEFDLCTEHLSADGSFPPLPEFWRRLQETRSFQDQRLEIDRALPYVQLVDSFLEQGWRRRRGGRVVGATVHKRFDRLPDIWPDARFIHLLRDPRDVARSCVQMGWYASVWSAASVWLEAEQAWDRLAARIPPARIVEVRYEDLVSRPDQTLSRITAFLGLPFSDAMLTYDKDTTYGRPDPASASQWRKKASPLEVRLIEARTGDWLARRGYAASAYPPLAVGALRAGWLAAGNRLGVWRFRIKRYGFWLLALAKLASSLPFEAPRRAFLDRINDIDRTYIK